eukprot:gene4553-6425_t
MSKKSESKEKGEDSKGADSGMIPSWAHVDFNEIELGERIGGGGVGIIYKGWWKDEQVALKTLFDARIGHELTQEYMDELLVMSKVKHTNIVSFLGACMTPPNLCFIMELCECSLFQLLHQDRMKYSNHEALQMAIDVGSAMEYLHSLSPAIIHRDLKSLNILRAFNGRLKLCDFGLVKVRNATAGTPAYMAPELIENNPYNKSVDVYAFGVLLWEILANEVPFYNVSISDIRQRVVSGNRPRLGGLNSSCSRLISQCWDQSPDNRPSFTEVVDELLRIFDEIPQNKHTENMKDCLDDSLESLLSKK